MGYTAFPDGTGKVVISSFKVPERIERVQPRRGLDEKKKVADAQVSLNKYVIVDSETGKFINYSKSRKCIDDDSTQFSVFESKSQASRAMFQICQNLPKKQKETDKHRYSIEPYQEE